MRKRSRLALAALIAGVLLIAAASVLGLAYFTVCGCFERAGRPLTGVSTVAGLQNEIGEPFGIAVLDGEIYVSDGLHNKIWRIASGQKPVEFAAGLSTPSAIAFDKNGNLIVADTGSHTIKKIDPTGVVSVLAGTEGQIGDADGPVLASRFNAPIGVAVLDDGSIAVADTYNDKIKLIRDGFVRTVAGSTRGFADGTASQAKFDTPCGLTALKDGTILVADTINSRIRVIDPNGNVSTFAGSDNPEARDGILQEAGFYRPYAIALGHDGSLYIGDGNALRVVRNGPLPIVLTVSKRDRGFTDGVPSTAKFNRISGIAISADHKVYLADSDNAAIRVVSWETGRKEGLPEYKVRSARTDPIRFRSLQPARWPYDPPDAKRDIAGTLGEIRGEFVDQNSQAWFHNGLDIAGGYGEKARFIRDEKVLDPLAADNFNTLRELVRLPAIGYIHIRLGRDSANQPFGDARFQFDPEMTGVRVRRGAEFRAGEVIGTLNAMNHVHMIAGPSGDEMNALDALTLPGVSDTIAPVIESVELLDHVWLPLETKGALSRIYSDTKARVVVRAFDRMDGNPERRRLGVYRLGYQVLNRDRSAVTEQNWNISFDRNPSPDAVKFAYAAGSKSGPTGETIFRYIVTNKVSGEAFGEGFLDAAQFAAGEYILRVFAADYFGNTTSRDISFEVAK